MHFDRLLGSIILSLLLPLLCCAQNISELVLVNANTDSDIGQLEEGATIDLASTGTNLNIRAEVSGPVGSVRFSYDGNNNFQTENVAPYAFAGDTGGDYNSWTPTLGEHTVTAIAYEGENASGDVLGTIAVNFTVISDNGGGGGDG
ncbi:MAG: hypothetical protein AAFR97_08685, partial [Bacteroidota bacterium]